MEAAVRPEQRAEEPPVELDEADQERAHRRTILSQSDRRLARICALVRLAGRRSRVHDEVQGGQFLLAMAEGFAHQALDAVAR